MEFNLIYWEQKMKKISRILMIALGISACGHDKEVEPEVAVIETQDQKVSYLMGIENGKGIGSTGINLDLTAYQQGFSRRCCQAGIKAR